MVIGFTAGLATGVILTSTADFGAEAVSPDQVLAPSTTELVDGGGAESTSRGIWELVDGFPDALVVLMETEGHSLTHLLWPVARPPVERPVPAGSFGTARFDFSGRWLASTTAVPGDVGSTLSMGILSSFTPLVSGVTSFAWHDSEPGDLAYIRVSGEEGSLWTARPDRTSSLVVDGLDPSVTLSSWGDWGFALQDPVERRVVLFTPDGELRSFVDGVAYGSHPSGWIVVSDGELVLVSAGGGVSRLGTDLDAVGAVLNAEFSPDRSLIAVRGDEGLVVVDADDGSRLRNVELPASNPDLAWSSDSRFVLAPHFRGVLVVDSHTASMSTVLGGRSVAAVGVIPLSSS